MTDHKTPCSNDEAPNGVLLVPPKPGYVLLYDGEGKPAAWAPWARPNLDGDMYDLEGRPFPDEDDFVDVDGC